MKRTLTPEEKRLWKQVTAKDVPLSSKRDVEMWSDGDVEIKISPVLPIIPTSPHPHIPTSLSRGAYANIDRNTAERFRKGQYPLDATFDLHGMSRDKAYSALHGFLTSQYAQDSRCLLVITGKGEVLREMLPQWLAEAPWRPMILAFDIARPKHGGAGAYYVLLRRKRKTPNPSSGR